MTKNAFLILAHEDHLHLKKLVESINYKCTIYIHIDAKKDIDIFKNHLKGFENVHFIKNRQSVYWGGYNMVKATLALIEEAIQSKEDYGHLVLISGNDYPVVSPNKIYDYFSSYRGTELIRGYAIEESNCKHCMNRVIKYNYFDGKSNSKILNRLIRKIQSILHLPFNKKTYISINGEKSTIISGSQWWGITTECAKYILKTIEDNDKIETYFKSSFAPDELFFHTIIFNSPFSLKTLNKEVEAYTGKWHWNNFHYLNTDALECPPNPTLKSNFKKLKSKIPFKNGYTGSTDFLMEKDFDKIENNNYIFIRKVNSAHSLKLIDRIDKTLEK